MSPVKLARPTKREGDMGKSQKQKPIRVHSGIKAKDAASAGMGAGLLSTDPVIRPSALVLPNDWDIQDSTGVLASIQLLTSHDQLTKYLETTSGAGFTISGVPIEVNASYADSVRIDNYTMSFLVSILVQTGTLRFAQDYEISDPAMRIYKADPTAFAERYGDLFCAMKVFGGYLTGIGTYTAYSREETQTISGSIAAGQVSFGAWGTAKESITHILQTENFNFTFKTEGPAVFKLGDGAVLKDPKTFFNACDSWIADALKNTPESKTAQSIRDYFLTYRAAGLDKAPAVDLMSYFHLLNQEQLAKDTLNRMSDILNDKESKYTGTINRNDVQKVQDYIGSIEDYLLIYRKDPFKPGQKPPPDFVAPKLPDFNRYSKQHVFNHFKKGGYADIQVADKIRTALNDTTGQPLYILPNTPYRIFHLDTAYTDPAWYCLPPDGVPRPPDARTIAQCLLPLFYIWGQEFTYNNAGTVYHIPSGTKGSLQLVKSALEKPGHPKMSA